MMKNMLVGGAAATTVGSDSSFCGCGVCDLDWLDGSAAIQGILLGLDCGTFNQLMTKGTTPPVTLTTGEACTDLLSALQGATVMQKAVSDFLGPNTTCPSGAAVDLGMIEQEEADKIKVDLYYESQCPGCRQMITTSFADAMKADGFLDMAEVNFWPYGNARESQSSKGDWDFSCQHGNDECQYNFIETCAKKHVQCPVQFFNFLNCVEKTDSGSDYEGVATQCATEAKLQNLDDIMGCYKGAEANSLEHDVALKTDALQPAHQWVPWVTVNDTYDESVQDEIGDSLLKYVCDNYKGAKKSKDCPPSGERIVNSIQKQPVCLKADDTAFLQ